MKVIVALLTITMLFSLCSASCPYGDLSGDCVVGFDDLVIFSEEWLTETLDCPETNLFAHWKLDEINSDFAYDSSGSFDGTLYSSPLWQPGLGRYNGALFFDGEDDYIKINGFKGFSGKSARTCSAWINTNSLEVGSIIAWGQTNFSGKEWDIRMAQNGTKGVLLVYLGNSWVFGSDQLNIGEWIHIAVVFPEGGTELKDIMLYFNGVLDTNMNIRSTYGGYSVNTGLSNDVTIGQYGNNYFNGQIDEVRLYNRELSSAEIKQLYLTGSTSFNCPDLTGDKLVHLDDFAQVAQTWMEKDGPVIISEFLASNSSKIPLENGDILDGNGKSSDWIELHNLTNQPISLTGWHLTDNPDRLNKWTFPEGVVIDQDEKIIVFASNTDDYPYRDPANYYHTNFSLSASGEYLALVNPDGNIVHQFASYYHEDDNCWGYPPQESDISYGILEDSEHYFSTPTPGNLNRGAFDGFVADTKFSNDRGIYTFPFDLTISCKTDDTVIKYTLDGTDPTISRGMTYTEPIRISTTSTIRAAAFRPGYIPSNIDTQTYIFNPTSSLTALPIFSLVGDPGQVFYAPDGIMAIVGGAYGGNGWYAVNPGDYNNVLQRGLDYERAVSTELLESDGSGFHENCGIRVHGSNWMRPRYRPPTSGLWYGDSKFSLRLYFRDEYGDTRLRYNLLPKYDNIDTFKTIVLRGGHNDRTNPFVRDEMIRRLYSDMGNVSSLGTFANVCINGEYKGFFNPCEHINDNFCQYHFNSEKEWDVMTMNGPRDGDAVSFNSMTGFARNNDLTVADNYIEMQRRLDVTNFIDYLMVQTWGANWDWPQNNWSAASEKSDQGKWRFFVWDAEGCMDRGTSDSRFVGDSRTLNNGGDANSILYKTLKRNADFRQTWCDRVQKHFYDENGAMTQDHLQDTFWGLRDEVIGVIPSFNTGISTNWIPNRESIYITQCIDEGLFTFKAPNIFVNNAFKSFGSIPEGSTITMTHNRSGSAVIYYTLDDTDPRTSATLDPGQGEATLLTILPENAPKTIKVPTSDIGTSWRTNIGYNDKSWNDGQPSNGSSYGGVGYENTSGYQDYIAYDVKTEMQANTSVYIRIKFDIDQEDLETFNYMKLVIRVDDSAVFYLNGHTDPLYSYYYSGVPQWNSTGGGSPEAGSPVTFDVSNHLSKLHAGENFMAIHGLNSGTGSSDYLVTVKLIAGYSPGSSSGGGEISDTAISYSQSGPFTLNKSTKIKARILEGNKWSALRDSAFTVGQIKNNLRITEINYNPGGDPNEEFIELRNIGNETINLDKAYFSNGIDYIFPDRNLTSGEYMILASDIDIFTDRYGDPGCFIDQFEGSLDNKGDKITMKSIDGITIQSVDFKDGWYDITDGEGFTLTPNDQQYTQTSGLVSLWEFDDIEGHFTIDATGNYTATLYNFSGPKWKDGEIGNSLLFDGVDDYAVINNYKGITGTHSRSVTAWIKTSQLESNGEIIGWGTNTEGNKFSIRLYNTSENHSVLRAEGFSGFTYGTINVSDGKWHHIAVTLQNDGSPNISEVKLYVDGVLDNNTSFPVSLYTIADENVKIGVFSDKFFNGKIDHLGIYSRALSQPTIQGLVSKEKTSYDSSDFWRPSALKGGSPGSDDLSYLPAAPGSIVINELLSHSHSFDPDWIELKNVSGNTIDISGWYLSDSGGNDPNRMKFKIPNNTILGPGDYVVFNEDDHFGINSTHPGRIIPFGLSEGGETLYLQSADLAGNLTGYYETESFGPGQSNVAFGRFTKSTGTVNFVAMSQNTENPPYTNKYPKVGPIVITEVHYNPGPGANIHYEFIELMNNSNSTVELQDQAGTQQSDNPLDYITETIPWKFTKGIDFTFPPGVSLQAKEKILIVKDIQAFTSRYNSQIPGGTQIFEWESGKLDNGGESIELSMPGDQEWEKKRFYIRRERVTYGDSDPWPADADGTGKSLQHIRPEDTGNNYSNDPVNWTSDLPTPGY